LFHRACQINDYDTTLSSKESKAAESKAARAALTQQFQEVDEILKEDIDTLMELMKQRNKEFYNQYQAARVIKDL
jgi:predicted transcriptional regulator